MLPTNSIRRRNQEAKPREPRLLIPGPVAAKKRLHRPINTNQGRPLNHNGHSTISRIICAKLGKLAVLIVQRYGLALLAPVFSSLLQCGVVELLVENQDLLQSNCLLGGRAHRVAKSAD